jgi:hypothetical protein
MSELGRGWGWPGLSKKSHYFIEGRSLCGKWIFMGALTTVDFKSPDDCADCRRRLTKMQTPPMKREPSR